MKRRLLTDDLIDLLVVMSGDTWIEHDIHIFIATIGRFGIGYGSFPFVTPVHFQILFGITIRSKYPVSMSDS
jgi:hypothetical protein